MSNMNESTVHLCTMEENKIDNRYFRIYSFKGWFQLQSKAICVVCLQLELKVYVLLAITICWFKATTVVG